MIRSIFLFVVAALWCSALCGQRSYKAHSVLASGNWYKIAIPAEGIYKIDVAFLNSLGINGSSFSSESIRIFGNGGGMLPESNLPNRYDDLEEIALKVVDGNDGLFNGADYLLFYANGPNLWQKDSVNRRFRHQKNLYADSSYYFITIGGSGKRVIRSTQPSAGLPVESYNFRLFHELDSVNLLFSGKEWLGEEFMDSPGRNLSRSFQHQLTGLTNGASINVVSGVAVRSINNPSRFDITLNNQPIQQLVVAATGAGNYDRFAMTEEKIANGISSGENISLRYNFVPGSFNAQGWLNWYEIHGRAGILMPVQQKILFFRDWNSVGNPISRFKLQNATAVTVVWDITDPGSPMEMNVSLVSNSLEFTNESERLREYVAFELSGVRTPNKIGKIENQDLHNTNPIDYLIISHPLFIAQAERLANFHRQRNGFKALVVNVNMIFNEFSSGAKDPVAIRDFIKMYYDKYSLTTSTDTLKYVLLFGDGSFDYKDRVPGNTSFVPVWETAVSFDPLNTYVSDDFFGFLDDLEDINSGLVINLLDVGIGRIPARSVEEAKNFVDKVESYYKPASFGSWRNNIIYLADDEDFNLHLQDAEIVTAAATQTNDLFNVQKIYLDEFEQVGSAGGARFPGANELFNNRIKSGALIWNYSGHGGASRLAEEVLVDREVVDKVNNDNRLPLVVTATCDFAPFDNPFINSLGEYLLLKKSSGSIALMTTTRLVFSFSNRLMNERYMRTALERMPSGKYRTLGESLKDAKNALYQTSADISNNRKFQLLGDPAMSLGFPGYGVRTMTVNGNPNSQVDTLSAGEKVIITGEIIDLNGNLVPSFNGTIQPIVFEKPVLHQTKGNDPTSIPTNFESFSSILFKGKATVSGGRFSFEFKMPKDINYQFGRGRISYYADNGIQAAGDHFQNFIVGGSIAQIDTDKAGPEINAWLNDEKFVNGSIVNQAPTLLLRLSDSSGINTTGQGIGHSITVTIDNDDTKQYVLNEFFESDLDNYRSGTVRFQLPALEPGNHSLRIKAWDALNNSSESFLDFVVVSDEELIVDHVLNYPNPFTTRTEFWFEHNKAGQELFVEVFIYTITGKLIRRLHKAIIAEGNRFNELEWNGRDEFGHRIGRGAYVYRMKISSGSQSRTIIQKLVVL